MLNTDKRKVVAVGASPLLALVDSDSATSGETVSPLEASRKRLEVQINRTFSKEEQEQISSIGRAYFVELRRLASIRSYLKHTHTHTHTLTHTHTHTYTHNNKCFSITNSIKKKNHTNHANATKFKLSFLILNKPKVFSFSFTGLTANVHTLNKGCWIEYLDWKEGQPPSPLTHPPSPLKVHPLNLVCPYQITVLLV